MVEGIFLEVFLEVGIKLGLLPKRNELQPRVRPGEYFTVLPSKGGGLRAELFPKLNISRLNDWQEPTKHQTQAQSWSYKAKKPIPRHRK